MVDLSIAEGKLVLHVRGADKLWAFKSTLEIVIALRDERYQALIVEVADPQAAVEMIRAASGGDRGNSEE